MNNRNTKEMKSLFEDPRFSRQAWQSVGRALLDRPAVKPIVTTDKEGFETYSAQVENYTYNSLANDIAKLQNGNSEPTELEMILGCQILRARNDTSAAIFIRDTLGAKPVDESKLDHTISNQYEQLSDEELEILRLHREKQQQQQQQLIEDTSPAATAVDIPLVTHDTIVNDNSTEGVK